MSSRVIGLDLGGDTARLVEGRLHKGAFELHRATAVPVHDLAASVASLGLKGLPVAVGVTGRDMILRTTQVPPVPLWQVRELISYEVEDIAEQSGDSLRADFNLLNGAAAYSDDDLALIALVRSSHIEQRSVLLKAAGLRVTGFTPNAVALYNAVVATDGGEGAVLAVNLRGQHTDVALIQDGDLLFARNLAGGGDTLSQAISDSLRVELAVAEQAKHRMGEFSVAGQEPEGRAGAVSRALEGAQRQIVGMLQSTLALARAQIPAPNLEVDRVLLSGAGASVPGFDQSLSRVLDLPVSLFDPTEGYVVGDAPELDQHGPDFAVATGLAMMALLEDGYRIQVESERSEAGRGFREKTLWLALAATALVLYLGVFAWSSRADAEAAEADRSALSRKVETNKGDVRAYERSLEAGRALGLQLAALENLSAPGAGLVTVLNLLDVYLPEELWVRSVRTVRSADAEFGGAGAPRPFVVVEGLGKEHDRNLADAVIEITTRLRDHPDVAAVRPHFAPDARGDFVFELRIDTSVIQPSAGAQDEASASGEAG